jgi:hypothetical protein
MRVWKAKSLTKSLIEPTLRFFLIVPESILVHVSCRN